MKDKEIPEESKKKPNAITNAFLIGFLIGIVIYGITVNGLGFFALLPLFLAYKLINNSKKK